MAVRIAEALFRGSSRALLEVGARRYSGEAGFLSVLHTWGQTLTHHPHVHCVVPAGALARDRESFKVGGARFFLPVRVLARVFKAEMLDELERLPGAEPSLLRLVIDDISQKKWVVYAKRPFGVPEQVLRYLARYTHKTAISDRRIVDVDARAETFAYKGYRHGHQTETMRLAGAEFLRRFVEHVLPRGFVRLRSFGFLANGKKAEKLALRGKAKAKARAKGT